MASQLEDIAGQGSIKNETRKRREDQEVIFLTQNALRPGGLYEPNG